MNYNEPGNIAELTDELRERWRLRQSDYFEQGIQVAKGEAAPASDTSWLFNPLTSGFENTVTTDIRWNAFPKRLLDNFGTKLAAWREADKSRGNHEEYCEWEVVRNPATQKITRVTFTTETFEYYEMLFDEAPDFLLALYHKHVSDQAVLADLQEGGRYNRFNKWNLPEIQNKRGVLMHMAAGPNTLQAAINLSAEATWPSVDENGLLITDEQGLIDCRGYGARERHSDPFIGAQINALTRAGNEISFAGPTGLYIDSVDLTGFEAPGGIAAEDLMRVIRGDSDHMMRIVFEAPAQAGFEIGDVFVDGNPIRFGGQIAEKLTIRVRGIARPAPDAPPRISCSGGVIAPFLEGLTNAGRAGSRRTHLQFLRSAE